MAFPFTELQPAQPMPYQDCFEMTAGEEETVLSFDDEFFLEQLVPMQYKGGDIQKSFPLDLHYLCTCTQSYPLDKELFEMITLEYLKSLVSNPPQTQGPKKGKGKSGVRPLIPGVVENAHQYACEKTGFSESKFRIWKPVIPKKTVVKKDMWQVTLFEEVTDTDGVIQVALESAVRTLKDKAKGKPKDDAASEGSEVHDAQASDVESIGDQQTVKRKRREERSLKHCVSPITSDQCEDEYLENKARAIMREFVDQYDRDDYQDRLDRLYQDFNDSGSGNYNDWAIKLYKIVRDNPLDDRAKQLNRDRGNCLKLIYSLVNRWDAWVKLDGHKSEVFEAAIEKVFQKRRLKRILAVCLVMDRAQCLYVMRDLSQPKGSAPAGMPWFSELHFRHDTPFARDHGARLFIFQLYLDEYDGYKGDDGKGPMNKRLFRILFLERLGFQNDEYFRELSMPSQRPTNTDFD